MGSAALSRFFAATTFRIRRSETARLAGKAVRVLVTELEAQFVTVRLSAFDLILRYGAWLILDFNLQIIRRNDPG
jgi:hypothetical protein